MIGHAAIRIFRSDSRDQFGFIGLARNDGATAGFSNSERLLAEDERDAILLTNSAVTRHAVLVEDGPNITAETHTMIGTPRPVAPRPAAERESAYQHGGSNRGSYQPWATERHAVKDNSIWESPEPKGEA